MGIGTHGAGKVEMDTVEDDFVVLLCGLLVRGELGLAAGFGLEDEDPGGGESDVVDVPRFGPGSLDFQIMEDAEAIGREAVEHPADDLLALKTEPVVGELSEGLAEKMEEDRSPDHSKTKAEGKKAGLNIEEPRHEAGEPDHRRIEKEIRHQVLGPALEAPARRARHVLEWPAALFIPHADPSPHPENEPDDGETGEEQEEPEVFKHRRRSCEERTRTGRAKTSPGHVATTHSRECMEAADRAAKEHDDYPLRYLRLDRRVDDPSKIVGTIFAGGEMETAINSNLEMR